MLGSWARFFSTVVSVFWAEDRPCLRLVVYEGGGLAKKNSKRPCGKEVGGFWEFSYIGDSDSRFLMEAVQWRRSGLL
ncbi:unnamed protein product [Amaranthus hypochondriacus]